MRSFATARKRTHLACGASRARGGGCRAGRRQHVRGNHVYLVVRAPRLATGVDGRWSGGSLQNRKSCIALGIHYLYVRGKRKKIKN